MYIQYDDYFIAQQADKRNCYIRIVYKFIRYVLVVSIKKRLYRRGCNAILFLAKMNNTGEILTGVIYCNNLYCNYPATALDIGARSVISEGSLSKTASLCV